MTENRQLPRYHRGIRIDSIPAAGFAGLLFAIASLALFLGIPAVRGFSSLSLIGGVLTAIVLHFWRTQTRW